MDCPPTWGRDRTSIAELLADERCSQAVLDFLANTDVGRTSGPPVAEEEDEAASEASEWKRGNRRSGIGREWRRRSGWGRSFEGDGFLFLSHYR